MAPPPVAPAPFTRRTPRVVAAARLRRRREREATGRFLVEGAPGVREALATPDRVRELFVTGPAAQQHPALVDAAAKAGVLVSPVTMDAAAGLSETVSPQGLVAVCDQHDLPLAEALRRRPRLVAVLVEIRDPGNAGTVLRTADAAGAGAVIVAGDAVDPYNGKCVRASAGSLFHLDLVRHRDPLAVVAGLHAAGLRTLAATAAGETDLDLLADATDPAGAAGRYSAAGLPGLAGPTAWLFGSEAHGLPAPVLAAAADRVRVPIHGRAESLNLGAAAAVCLYASARAQRASAQ